MTNWVDWLIGVDRATIEGADWTIEWRNLPPTWVTVLLIVPAIFLFAAILYRRENKTASSKARWLLAYLRMALILLLFFALAEPVLHLEWQNVKESYVVCLLDDSKSMTLVDKMNDAESRKKLAKVTEVARPDEEVLSADQERELAKLRRVDLLNRALANRMFDPKEKGKDRETAMEKLAERYNLRVYSFSDHLSEITGEFTREAAARRKAAGEPPAPNLEATGESTAIGEMLAQNNNDMNGQTVAAIVLFTDGKNTSGQDPVAWVERQAEHGGLPPVYAVGVGNPADPRNIAITGLTAPDVALAKDPVNFEIQVKSKGFEGQNVELILQDKDQILEKKTITLKGGDAEQTESLQHKFDRPGDVEVKVLVPPDPGESVETDNVRIHHIKIVDEKIKVLFVDGYPRWEYRYLKNALIRDKSMIVSCYLQSADDDFPQEGSPGTQPMKEFPMDRKELFDFDVILLGDVDFTDPDFIPGDKQQEAMQNVSDFVEEIGGGIAFMAGFRGNPKNYRNTPLAKLLPVVLEDSGEGVGVDVSQTESFYPHLTEEGKRSPMMKLDPNDQVNENLWEANSPDALPGLFWFFQVKRAKPGAQVLAEHPTAKNSQGKPFPLVATQPYGRGRTLFVATDETWRWRFIRGDRYFYAFWGEAIRFLRGGKLLGGKRYDVKTDKPIYTLTDRVKIEAIVRDEQYNPVTDEHYPATIETPSGVKVEIEMTLDKEKKGTYRADYTATEVGVYQIWVGPDVIGEEKERAYATFEVKMPTREFEDPLMDRKSLERIAVATHGTFLPLYDLDQLPDKVNQPSEVMKPESKEKDLWNSPGVFLLFALLITLEWVLRKKFRLL